MNDLRKNFTKNDRFTRPEAPKEGIIPRGESAFLMSRRTMEWHKELLAESHQKFPFDPLNAEVFSTLPQPEITLVLH
jgi:hypothetical protein